MSAVSRLESPLAPLRGVPATVVGGWLGSGKTTLINGWLRQEPRPDWAVLVNDPGALAIDADRLRGHSGRVLELSDGCLCCSLRDGLGEALLALAQLPKPPAHLVIETSGMAIPERVAAQLPLHGLRLERLLLLVDLERIESLWHDPWVGEVVQQQFQGVDWLQISKADRLEHGCAEARQRWLLEQLGQMRRQRQLQPSPPAQSLNQRWPAEPLPAFSTEPGLARTDHWLQQRPLRREALRRWAEGLGPQVLRLKGEVWLEEQPQGPVRLDGCPFGRLIQAGEGGREAGEGWLNLAEAPERHWPSSLRRQGRLVVISRAGAEPPRWPLLDER